MSSIFWLLTGILILGFTVYDLLYTTLVPSGAGRLTRWVTDGVYKVMISLTGNNGRHWLLNYSGMTTMITILLVWLGLIWISNTFILMSDTDSILNSSTKFPTSFTEKLYFTGYTISTLGNGEYIPKGSLWQIYVTFLSFSGLILLTISLSYIIPVLSADLEKRSLAIYINALGKTPQDIILNAWDEEDGLKGLSEHLNEVNQQIMLHGQKHLAYPVLHYYHSTVTNESAPINIVTLDEALTILLLYIPQHVRPLDADIILLRKSINTYLSTLNQAFIQPDSKPLPNPNIDNLRKAGIPIVDNIDEKSAVLTELSHRRSLLSSLLEHDGWTLKDLLSKENHLSFNDPQVQTNKH